jgi:PhnB protein
MMLKLNPYLTFDGNCEEAVKLYAKILKGEITAMVPFDGTPAAEHVPADMRNKILHSSLKVGDDVLMASDAPREMYQKMQGISVTLVLKDPDEAERIYNALSEGGKVNMPLEETFWAKKFGMVTDRFGTPWMVNCEKPA